jgi:hypothetical protein
MMDPVTVASTFLPQRIRGDEGGEEMTMNPERVGSRRT